MHFSKQTSNIEALQVTLKGKAVLWCLKWEANWISDTDLFRTVNRTVSSKIVLVGVKVHTGYIQTYSHYVW